MLMREQPDVYNPQNAKQVLQRAIAANDKNSMAYAVLGNAYIRLHDPAHALQAYQRAMALDPKNPTASQGVELAKRQLSRQ